MNFSEVMTTFCGEKLNVFDTAVPAFSYCFETLVFTCIPFTLLAVTSAYYIGRLKIPDLNIKTPWRLTQRQICTFVTLAFTVANCLITIFPRNAGQGYVTVTFMTSTLGLLVHFFYLLRLSKVHFSYKRGPWLVTASWLLTFPHFVANTEHVLARVIKLNSMDYLVKIQAAFSIIACVSHIGYLVCILCPNLRFRTVSVVEEAVVEEQEHLISSGSSSSYYQLSTRSRGLLDRRRCPVDDANVFSKLFFYWVRPLMKQGAKRLLTDEESVLDLPEDILTSVLDEKFSKALLTEFNINNDEQDAQNSKERNILLRAMHKTFGSIYYASGILKLLADALAFAGPLLLNKLVNYIENIDEPAVHGYYYATGLFLSSLIGSLLSAHFDYQVNKVKLRLKSALITNIYGKTLRAQPSDLSSYSIGEITNFMSTDVDRVVNFCASFHEFWSLPFQVAVTLYLFYQQVGIVFLAGVGLAVIMIIFNRYLANKIGQYNAAMMKEKDSRVRLMTEILLGIRVIKFNAWEYFMSEKLERIRNEELKSLKGIKYFDAGCVYLWATTPVLISLLTFSIYSSTGHQLTAAKVFTVIALINMLITPLNAFPWVVNGLMEAWISLKRLNKFIKIKNLELEEYYDFPTAIQPDDMDVVVDMKKSSFSRNSVINKNNDEVMNGKDQGLSDITLQVREGQFIGVIGTVGSGKSSLLSAILAEMQKDDGSIYVDCVNDGFAVVTQEPWLQHATIRDNILWGKPFDAHRYQSIVEACALVDDFKMFLDKDLTEVGENGVTLSGGQKVRVALARAVYQDKSLYLLDDPLSAVDQHVGSHLHDRCIIGELADKTRILCTHHTKYLRHADVIVVMENGKIKEIGTPNQILQLTSSNHKIIQKKKSNLSAAASSESLGRDRNTDGNTRLMTEEDRAVGTVAFNVYKSYWFAIGSYLSASILLFLCLMQGTKVTSDWWLSYWVTNIKSNISSAMFFLKESPISNANFGNISRHSFNLHFIQPMKLSITSYTTLYSGLDHVSELSHDTRWYLMIYGIIAASNSLFTFFRSFLFAYGGIKAAQIMHSKLLRGVLQAPISFFDVTPVGRILNRFSSDTYTVDDSLPFILNTFLAQFVGVIGTIVITCYGLPWFAIALVPLGAFYFYIQHYYRLTSRELKRLSSVSLSPIYAHFTETLSGLTTIRAFRKHKMFRGKNIDLVTSNQRCNFSTLAAQEWFGVRLQMIGVAMVTTVAFVTVFMHQSHSLSPGLAGLALSYALSITSRLSGVITSFTETEKQMVAVERESHYINNISTERKRRSSDLSSYNDWPSIGTIEFSGVSLRYREGLPLALEKISFKIESGEKIGIVGRTGSGKSSLLMLLFGMIEACEGNIYIDGIDIKHIPLNILRSGLSIIPQDPFLFSGSIQENLVPNTDTIHDEKSLLLALERCNLKEKVIEMGGLYTNAGERGKRLSVGQRQLLCLARALLTNSKIVCLDEATASVDGECDILLQKTIREQFQNRTVLTIAHRIETILDCDRVLVLDDGHVAEFGNPDTLMTDSDSLFYKLASASGSTNS